MGKTKTATLVPDESNARITDHHTKRLWKVRSVADGRLFIGYFKHLPACQLASEIICAAVGRAIGLNIPEFYLARPLPEMGQQDDLPAVGFLSAQKRFHLFATWGDSDIDRMQAATGWGGYHLTGSFDEWVANIDRRLHNLIYDPTDRDFWLIDHAHAFGSPTWETDHLTNANAQWDNLFLEFERQTKGASEINKWITAANNVMIHVNFGATRSIG